MKPVDLRGEEYIKVDYCSYSLTQLLQMRKESLKKKKKT